MAKPGGAAGRKPVPRRGAKRASNGGPRGQAKPREAKRSKVVFDADPVAQAPRTFRLGVIPGATPGKWVDAWKQRMPDVPVELVPIEVADQRSAIDSVDAALVRLPLDDADAHVITLYDEMPVVVASSDSHLMAVDELTAADLAGEVQITPMDDTLALLDLPGTLSPAFPALPTTADAIATVAAGVGFVVVPMSLARLHQRKDADHRPLIDGPVSTVALAWRREGTTADVETFIGIVRGRTANSSR